jgi:hypothetical protein
MRLHSLAVILVIAVVGKLPAQDAHPESSRPFKVIDSIPAPESVAIGPDRAYCWGYNENGQIGDGTYYSPRLTPTAVSGGLIFKQVDAGAWHTC